MPTYFITFYGMTVYVNISVIYPLIQADPSRPSDRMAAKFWSSLLQPMACPQYGAKWVPEPIVT